MFQQRTVRDVNRAIDNQIHAAQSEKLTRRMNVVNILLSIGPIIAGLAFVVRYVPTFIATPVTVYSDAGVFMSMFHQLSQSRHLYTEVFDHKDPLFYVGYTIAYTLTGLRGPMLWEFTLTALLLMCLGAFIHHLKLPFLARLGIVLVFCALYFLPDVYVPVHTYHQATVLFVSGLLLTAVGWPLAAGLAVGAAIASKMTMVLLVPGWLAFTVAHDEVKPITYAGLRRAVRAAAGVVLLLLSVLLVLTVRGEIGGYYEAVLQNLAYPSLNPPMATDFPGQSLWQGARSMFLASGVGAFVALVVLAISITAVGIVPIPASWMSWRRWVHACAATADVAALAAGVGLATTALLWTVSWWSHHFQPVGLAFSLLLIPPVAFFQRVQLPGSALLRTIARALGILVIVGAGVLVARVPLYARFTTQELLYRPVNECQLFATIAQPWMVTQECLVTQETFAPGTRIATLQENGRGTLLAWTPPDIVVACRVFYQFPWFRPELLQEALDCLKSPEVDVVLRIPYWFPFSSFEQQTHDILDERFQLSRRDGVIEVWERRR